MFPRRLASVPGSPYSYTTSYTLTVSPPPLFYSLFFLLLLPRPSCCPSPRLTAWCPAVESAGRGCLSLGGRNALWSWPGAGHGPAVPLRQLDRPWAPRIQALSFLLFFGCIVLQLYPSSCKYCWVACMVPSSYPVRMQKRHRMFLPATCRAVVNGR